MPRQKFPNNREVVNTTPLSAETKDQHCPAFLEDVKEGKFKKDDKSTIDGEFVGKFRNDFMRQVYYLARLGANDDHIAEFFGIHPRTVDSWRSNNPDFMEAYLQGKWMFGLKIVEALGNRALGYEYVETEEGTALNKKGEVVTVSKKITKHMPADVTAGMFILKNRFRDMWSDTTKHEIETKSISIIQNLDLTELSIEEQRLLKNVVIRNVKQIQGVSDK